MKTFLLTIIACALSVSCFAWQTFPEATKNMTAKQIEDLKKENDGKFYIACDHEGDGISLIGFNEEDTTIVNVRKVKDKYDIKVKLYAALWSKPGNICVRFRDKEGFELVNVLIGPVGEKYSGDLHFSHTGSWKNFDDIDSYEVNMKG